MSVDSATYAQPASAEAIERTRAALEGHGISALVVDTPEQAKAKLFELIPEGASVGSGASVTLDEIGATSALHEPGRYDRVRVLARLMDRDHVAQGDVIRKLLASTDYVVGSANAATEDGSLIFGSMIGSQLGPYVSAAGKVILVIGAQKIVRDVDAGLRRLREYCLPLESERVRKASGVTGTRLNSVLIINGSAIAGRMTVIIVRQALGY